MSLRVSQVVLRCRVSLAAELCLLDIARLTGATKSRNKLHRRKLGVAASRFRLVLAEYLDEKAGFREDQPRWPKGSGEESGRWSGGAGGAAATEEGAALPPKGGHHLVPREIFTDPKIGLSEDAKRVFERGVTGSLKTDFHKWNEEHKMYNNAVRQNLSEFLSQRSIDSGKMTAEQASEFLRLTRGSSDPRIGGYNRKIFWREIIYFIRRGPKWRGAE